MTVENKLRITREPANASVRVTLASVWAKLFCGNQELMGIYTLGLPENYITKTPGKSYLELHGHSFRSARAAAPPDSLGRGRRLAWAPLPAALSS